MEDWIGSSVGGLECSLVHLLPIITFLSMSSRVLVKQAVWP